jgi:hypothetical protein
MTPHNYNQHQQNDQDDDKYTTNPYNFVSLNEVVVESNANSTNENQRHSGKIQLTLTPESPIFIRGKGADFFTIGDRLAIPGSSIKGMLRTLIEVIGHGNVGPHIANNEAVKDIKALLPPQFNQPKTDFASTLFGDTQSGRGKLIIEDAICNQIVPKNRLHLKVMNTLLSPSPKEALYYYDPQFTPQYARGNKFYWHMDLKDKYRFSADITVSIKSLDQMLDRKKISRFPFEEKLVVKNKDGMPTDKYQIKFPSGNSTLDGAVLELRYNSDSEELKGIPDPKILETMAWVLLPKIENPKTEFESWIRYDDLTTEELGLVLLALDLDLNAHYYHHIGLGKPYGLGRIAIKTEVFEINRRDRYTAVLDAKNKWQLAENKLSMEKTDQLKGTTANYILQKINKNQDQYNEADLWDTPRMQELLYLHQVDPFNSSHWENHLGYPSRGHTSRKKKLKSVMEIKAQIENEYE